MSKPQSLAVFAPLAKASATAWICASSISSTVSPQAST